MIIITVNVSGPSSTFSQDAKGKGKETILVNQLPFLFCGWWDAFYVGGTYIARIHTIFSIFNFIVWDYTYWFLTIINFFIMSIWYFCLISLCEGGKFLINVSRVIRIVTESFKP